MDQKYHFYLFIIHTRKLHNKLKIHKFLLFNVLK